MNGWSYLCVDKEMLFVGRIWDEIWRIYTSAGLYWSVVEYLYFLETLFESKLFGLYQPSIRILFAGLYYLGPITRCIPYRRIIT